MIEIAMKAATRRDEPVRLTAASGASGFGCTGEERLTLSASRYRERPTRQGVQCSNGNKHLPAPSAHDGVVPVVEEPRQVGAIVFDRLVRHPSREYCASRQSCGSLAQRFQRDRAQNRENDRERDPECRMAAFGRRRLPRKVCSNGALLLVGSLRLRIKRFDASAFTGCALRAADRHVDLTFGPR